MRSFHCAQPNGLMPSPTALILGNQPAFSSLAINFCNSDVISQLLFSDELSQRLQIATVCVYVITAIEITPKIVVNKLNTSKDCSHLLTRRIIYYTSRPRGL
jgi:hypothetical protein